MRALLKYFALIFCLALCFVAQRANAQVTLQQVTAPDCSYGKVNWKSKCKCKPYLSYELNAITYCNCGESCTMQGKCDKYNNPVKTGAFSTAVQCAGKDIEYPLTLSSSTANCEGGYLLKTYNGDNVCISGGEYVGGSFDGCKAMPHRLFESRKCFLCPLFKVVFEAMDTVSYKSMIVLNKSFMAISAMMMALYIAIVVLGHVSQVTKQEAPKFINAIIKQSAKFVIAFLLLMNYTQVYHWVVVPLLDGGLELAGHISSDVEVSLGTDENVSSVRPKILGYHTSKGVSSIVFDRIQSFLRKVQNRLGFMQSVGGGLLCASSSTFGTLSASMFMPAFEMLFLGLIVSGFSILLSFAFAFYLIDAVVQLGVLGALMPLLILSWPFKVTSKYTKKGMEWLINIFVVFSMMALLVNINFALVDHALAQGKTPTGNGCVKEHWEFSKEDWEARLVSAADLWIKSNLNTWFNAKLDYWKVHPSCNIPLLDGGAAALMDDDTVMCMPLSEVNKLPKCGDESSYKTGGSVETLDISSGMKKSALAGMYDAIHLNQLSKLKQMVNITGTGFLILIIGCWFGFKLIGKVNELASKFAGGAVSGIGSSMATMAGSLSKGMVTGAAAPILAGAGKTVSRTLEVGTKNFAVGAVQLPFKAAHYGGSLLTGGNYAKGINQNLANKFNNIVGTVSKVSQNVVPALKNSNVQTVAATSAIAFAASGANINAATPPVPTKAQVMNLLTKEGDNVEENGDLSVITHKDGTQSEVSKDGGVNFSSGVTEFNKDGETHYVNSAGKRISKEEADNLEKIAAKRSRDFAETTQSELPPDFPKPPAVNAEQNSNVQSAKINNNQEKHKQNAAQSRANNNQQKQSDVKKPKSNFEKLQAKTAFEKAKAEFEKNKKIADNRQKKHLELMKENGDVVNTRKKDGFIHNKVDGSIDKQKDALKETVIKHKDGSYSVITSGGDGHSFSGGHSRIDENGNSKFYNLEGKEITAEEYRAMNENVDKRNKYFADEYNKAHANDSMNEEKRKSGEYKQEREVLYNYLQEKGQNTKENVQRIEEETKASSDTK